RLAGFERLGSLEQVSEVVKRARVDDVFIALPAEQHAMTEDVILRLQADPVRIHFVPDILELTMVRARVEDFDGIPVVSLREPPLDEAGRIAKRSFDLLAGGLITLVAAPVMAACAVAIRLYDRGPVFFRQKRIGENCQPFDMLKFRSMVGDAEGDLKAARANNALFFPVNPGHEEASWKRFYAEAAGRFFAGTYAGQYEEALTEEFMTYLPSVPPWKKPISTG
ncbi:MAG: sugar transferase, partial [bacterium]